MSRSRPPRTGACAHRRSERRGRARLPHGLRGGGARCRGCGRCARESRHFARAPRRRDRHHQGPVRRRGRADARGLEDPRRCAAGQGRRAGRAAAARGRRRDRRQDQHERVRVLRRRHEPALRHAGQSGGPRARAGRLVVGRRRVAAADQHVRDRDRHRHRRLDAAFRPRSAASSASSRASGACRPRARSRSPITLNSIGPLARTVADCAQGRRRDGGRGVRAARACAGRGPAARRAAGLAAHRVGQHGRHALRRRAQEARRCRRALTDEPMPLLDDMLAVNAKGGFAPAEAFAIHREQLAQARRRIRSERAGAHRARRETSPPPTMSRCRASARG